MLGKVCFSDRPRAFLTSRRAELSPFAEAVEFLLLCWRLSSEVGQGASAGPGSNSEWDPNQRGNGVTAAVWQAQANRRYFFFRQRLRRRRSAKKIIPFWILKWADIPPFCWLIWNARY